MLPNLELILLLILHGSFIASILLLFTSLVLLALLLAFFLGLFSLVVIDLYDIFPLISWCFQTTKANLELGFVLILCVILRRVVNTILLSIPFFQRVLYRLKAKAMYFVFWWIKLIALSTVRSCMPLNWFVHHIYVYIICFLEINLSLCSRYFKHWTSSTIYLNWDFLLEYRC